MLRFLKCSCFIFLCMDSFEHTTYFLAVFSGDNSEDVPEEMHTATLVFCFWKNLRYGITHCLAFANMLRMK
jgi:hypothetical protein